METSIQVRLCVPGPSGLATGSPAPSRKRSGTRGIALAPAPPTGPLPGTRDRSVRHVAAAEACDARVGFNATHEPDSRRVTASTSRRPDTARVYDSSPLRWAGQSPTDSTFQRPRLRLRPCRGERSCHILRGSRKRSLTRGRCHSCSDSPEQHPPPVSTTPGEAGTSNSLPRAPARTPSPSPAA